MRDTFWLSVLVVIILLFVTASGNMAFAQTASNSGTVSDQAKPVLDRAIQFLGGAENIKALRDLDVHAQGTTISAQGTSVELREHDIIIYPGITRYEHDYRGHKSSSVEFYFDGTNGWRMDTGTLRDLNEVEKRIYRLGRFNELGGFNDLHNLLGLIGSPTVTYEGKNGGNDVLLFALGDLSVRSHIDSTGQVVKLAYHGTLGDIEETLSDYREVGGVKIAYKISATLNGNKHFDTHITEATANTNPSLETLALKTGGGQQSASWEQALHSQYPKGTVLNLMVTDVFGSAGCKVGPPWSTYKDGKMHPPGFGQNVLLGTANCQTQPIALGTALYLSGVGVDKKNNRISFVVTQCNVADCSSGMEGATISQVNFDFTKGFLEGAQLSQLQDTINHVFSIVSSPAIANQQGQDASAASGPVSTVPLPPAGPLKLPSAYVSAQSQSDQLQLNPDRSFSLQEGGQPYHGTFVENGATVELSISETGTKSILSRQGDNLTDSSGQTWSFREHPGGTVPGGAMLYNEDIIKMAQAGLDDAIIISKISSSKCQFDTSTDALIQLKHGGISGPVLKAMVGSGK